MQVWEPSKKAGRLVQVGAFPHYGGRWAEWNGNFRDTVRQFIKGTEGPFAAAFASAVCGSPSIYAAGEPGEGEPLGAVLCGLDTSESISDAKSWRNASLTLWQA